MPDLRDGATYAVVVPRDSPEVGATLPPGPVVIVSLPAQTPSVGVTPPAPSDAVVLPVPGAPGRPGPPGRDGSDLSPEQLDMVSDRVAADLVDELEPPIDLTVLFENSLA